MKKLFLIFLILFAFAACRDKPIEPQPQQPQPQQPQPQQPQPPKQYSTWIVNGTDTFRTNENIYFRVDCNPDHSYCRSVLALYDPSGFTLSFPLDYFPDAGKFILTTNTSVSNRCAVQIYYNGQFYDHTPSKIDTVYASSVNYKVNYKMPACWFVNYDNPTDNPTVDSILVEGNFNQP